MTTIETTYDVTHADCPGGACSACQTQGAYDDLEDLVDDVEPEDPDRWKKNLTDYTRMTSSMTGLNENGDALYARVLGVRLQPDFRPGWLKVLPTPETAQAWMRAHDEYAAHQEEDRRRREAERPVREAAEKAAAAAEALKERSDRRYRLGGDTYGETSHGMSWYVQDVRRETGAELVRWDLEGIFLAAVDDGVHPEQAARSLLTTHMRDFAAGITHWSEFGPVSSDYGHRAGLRAAFVAEMTKIKEKGEDKESRERKAQRIWDKLFAEADDAGRAMWTKGPLAIWIEEEDCYADLDVPESDWRSDYRDGRLDQSGIEYAVPVVEAVAVELFTDEAAWGFDFHDMVSAPSREEVLTGVIEAAAITLLLGRHGAYKTFVAIAWGLIVATGGQWRDNVAVEAVPVVYVAAEDAAGVRDRAAVIARELGLEPERGTFSVYHRTVRLNNPAQVAELMAYVKAKGAKLVIFDTLHKLIAGLTEGNDVAGLAYAVMDDMMLQTGAATLVLHHTGYAGEHARNASALEDDAAYVFLLDFAGDDRRASNPRRLVTRKVKNGATPEPYRIALHVLSKTEAYVSPEDSEEHEAWSASTLATALDAAGIELSAGEPAIMKWVRQSGKRCSARVVRKAIEIRRPAAD